MKKIKVAYIDHTPIAGGAQYVLGNHLKFLDKKTFVPVVICSNRTPELLEIYQQSGAKVITVGFGKLKSIKMLYNLFKTTIELLKIFKSEKPDLVVTNTVRAHITATLAAWYCKIPLIWIIRDYTFSRPIFSLLKFEPKKILTVSDDLLEFYSIKGLAKAQVIFVGSDFDIELKKVSQTQERSLKSKLGLKLEERVIGFVGRLVEWKGAQVLIKAMPKVLEHNPNAKAVIVGGGGGQEKDSTQELKKLVKELSLEKHIIFCGFVPVKLIAPYFKIFDVFVHTSIEPEPFATVVVNALMVPLPLIGTDIGGTPELIKNGDNGLLVKPNDPINLAKALILLLKDTSLALKMAKRGYASVYPRLTEKEVTKRVEKIFREVVSLS